MEDNFSKLQKYDVNDPNGKIHHHKWISKLEKRYQTEPAMEDTLLDILMQFTF